jgi:hypothetical protein
MPGSGTLTCRIEVGGVLSAQASAHGTGTVVIPPTVVSYQANGTVRLCAEFVDDDGTAVYWDDVAKTWTGAPSNGCIPPNPPVADCPYSHVSGSISYSPAVQSTSGPVTWDMTLQADCFGLTPLTGHYDLSFSGSGTESCTTGSGSATVTGTGPNGALTGTWSFTRGGIHYYGYQPSGHGEFTDATGTYQMAWWLDIVPTGSSCPISTADVTGHGALARI